MHATYLVFGYRGARYGLNIALVREIVWLPELSPIEELPAYIVGVFNLHGQVVPVMDLALRFGHAPAPWSTTDRVIVIEGGEGRVGIVANELHDVLNIAQAEIENPERYHGAGGQAHFVCGEAKTADGLVMLLDAPALLRDTPAPQALETMAGAGSEARLPRCMEHGSAEALALLHRRALELARVPPSVDEAMLEPYAVIRLEGELFGLSLTTVREFAHLRGITPIPCCPPHVLGNILLRGNLVTVIDIRPAVGIGTGTLLGEVVVVQAGEQVLGVPAAEIVDVIRLAPVQLAAAPVASQSLGKAFCKGVAVLGDRTVDILDLERLVAADELQVMEEVQ